MTSADSDTSTDTGTEVDPAGESEETGDSGDSGAEEKPARFPRLPVVALSVAVALVVAAASVAVWFGVAWFQASGDDNLEFSGKRDEVDRVARTAIKTMNTLDYRKLDQGLADWADITTGPLHDEIVNLTPDKKKQLADAKPVTSANITSSAVKELDDRGGKATVIAAIEKTVQTADGKPQVSYQPLQANLTRTKDGWKLESLEPVQYVQPQ
jgi:Mce-associated membrane protein